MTRIFPYNSAEAIDLKRLTDDFRNSDRLLTLLTATATVFGALLIFSLQRAGTYNYLRPQLIAAGIGIAAAFVTAQADYRIIIKKWYFAAIAAAVLAGSVFLFGMRVSGTDDTAWITLPFGMTVQPSEFYQAVLYHNLHLSYLSAERKKFTAKAVGGTDAAAPCGAADSGDTLSGRRRYGSGFRNCFPGYDAARRCKA